MLVSKCCGSAVTAIYDRHGGYYLCMKCRVQALTRVSLDLSQNNLEIDHAFIQPDELIKAFNVSC